jgi:hypothetical protein
MTSFLIIVCDTGSKPNLSLSDTYCNIYIYIYYIHIYSNYDVRSIAVVVLCVRAREFSVVRKLRSPRNILIEVSEKILNMTVRFVVVMYKRCGNTRLSEVVLPPQSVQRLSQR